MLLLTLLFLPLLLLTLLLPLVVTATTAAAFTASAAAPASPAVPHLAVCDVVQHLAVLDDCAVGHLLGLAVADQLGGLKQGRGGSRGV